MKKIFLVTFCVVLLTATGVYAYLNLRTSSRINSPTGNASKNIKKDNTSIPNNQDQVQIETYTRYTSKTINKFSFLYPSLYTVEEGSGTATGIGQFVRLRVPGTNKYYQINCPYELGNYGTELLKPGEYSGYDERRPIYFERELTVNGNSAVQFVVGWSLETMIKDKTKPMVCSLRTYIGYNLKNYEESVNNETVYNAILNSFEFK